MARKPVMSTTQVWLRVLVLLGGLFGVFYSMNSIKKNRGLDVFFAPQPSTQNIKSGKLNLCPTRVSKIEVRDNRNNKTLVFSQKDTKWVVMGDHAFELEPLFMEKWLAEFCEVTYEAAVPPSEPSQQDLKFFYIDGSQQSIQFYGDRFATDVGSIHSIELGRAMARLNP